MAENLSKEEQRAQLKAEIRAELPDGYAEMTDQEREGVFSRSRKLFGLALQLWVLDNPLPETIHDNQLTSLEDLAAELGIDLDSVDEVEDN